MTLASLDVPQTMRRAPVEHASTTGRTSEETSLSLVWDENLGSGTLIDKTAVRPSRQSSPVSATFLAGEAAGVTIAGDLARQGAAEAGKMVPASRCGMPLVKHSTASIAVVPPHRAFDDGAVALGFDHDRTGHQRRLVAIEISHERLDAAS